MLRRLTRSLRLAARPTAMGAMAIAVLAGFVPSRLVGRAAGPAERLALPPASRFVEGPCRPDVVQVAGPRCGTLSVPEDYDRPEGRRIDLSIAIVQALDPRPGRVPLYLLSGGPGLPSVEVANDLVESAEGYILHNDAVLVDRRGTGGSAPLRCPEIERRAALQRMYPPDLVTACRKELERGADLTRYSTIEAARDIDEVRAALGQERIDLYGLSYGTQLAREVMRQFPDRVHAAVLFGAPPAGVRTPLDHAAGAQRALDLIFHACRSDPACRGAYPRLGVEWASLLARLEQGPVEVAWPAAGADAAHPFAIRRAQFGEAFRGLLEVTETQMRVPRIIHAAASGDFGPFLAEMTPPDGGSGAIAEGLYLSVVCGEETSRIDPKEIEGAVSGTFLGDYRVREQIGGCALWPTRPLPSPFLDRPPSKVPTLFITGTMDHVAPPVRQDDILRRYPNGAVVEMPHATHVYFTWGPAEKCLDGIAQAFLERGSLDGVDTSCTLRTAPPAFELPGAKAD